MTEPIRKLAIVGASARAAAFSAIRAGYEVVAADMFADADLARFAPVTRIKKYPEALAAWLAATECDAWMYTGALENHPELVDRMATIKPLAGNSGKPLRDVRDPLKLQAFCKASGVLFPETHETADGLPHDGSWLCKTYRGANGSGVWRLDGEAALAHTAHERAVFQRFVPGEPASASYILKEQDCFPLGVTRQLLGRGHGEWRYDGSLGPISVDDLDRPLLKSLVRLGDGLSQELGLHGLVGVDLVLDGTTAWVIEVNPRYSASVEIIERRGGTKSVMARHIAACFPKATLSEKGRIEVVFHSRYDVPNILFAKSIIFADRDVRITREFNQWAIEQSSTMPELCRIADIPNIGEVIPAGRPVLTAFADGASPADCAERLEQRLAEIGVRLYRD